MVLDNGKWWFMQSFLLGLQIDFIVDDNQIIMNGLTFFLYYVFFLFSSRTALKVFFVNEI